LEVDAEEIVSYVTLGKVIFMSRFGLLLGVPFGLRTRALLLGEFIVL
jgi:hypothetical protein